MDIKEARALAAAHIREGVRVAEGLTPVIIDEATRTMPWGWVFFYDCREYIETHDDRYLIAGNAPIAVTLDGKIHETGTAKPVDEYLREIGRRYEVPE